MAGSVTDSKTSSLTDLCQISKDACDAVAPMLKAFYDKISAGETCTQKLKADATFFSIADGIVQHMFIEYLLCGSKFGQIVGEEDETAVNIKVKPYTVDDLVVPDEFSGIIEETLEKVKTISNRIAADSPLYKKLTVFVDPIDGTREFATKQGECVTILLGFNDEVGKPVAGIMYRPLTEPPTWAAGAASENCVMGNLDMAVVPNPTGLLITDGKVSPFISKVIDELNFVRVPSLASGNRAMMLLEGKAGAYLRDTGGFALWDTSGPQAVIDAYGGTMSKLPPFLVDKSLVSYTHLKSNYNLDFIPNTASMTMTNIKDKSLFKKGEEQIIQDVSLVKEYSCMCGLVALSAVNMDKLDTIQQAMLSAMKIHPPTFT
eukprot:gene8687-11738_t